MQPDEALQKAINTLGAIADDPIAWGAEKSIEAAEVLLKWQAASGQTWVWRADREQESSNEPGPHTGTVRPSTNAGSTTGDAA